MTKTDGKNRGTPYYIIGRQEEGERRREKGGRRKEAGRAFKKFKGIFFAVWHFLCTFAVENLSVAE